MSSGKPKRRRSAPYVTPLVVVACVAAAALFALLGGAAVAQAGVFYHYPDDGTTAYGVWPTDSQWTPISVESEGYKGSSSVIDFVGNATYPGMYTCVANGYWYFRVRVAYSGDVVAGTFNGNTVMVLLDPNGDADPDWAFAWDREGGGGDADKQHGLEMQVFNSSSSIWNNVRMQDYDGNSGQKLVPPDIARVTSPTTGNQGYIRTVDHQSTATWGDTTFIDYAIKQSYLETYKTSGPSTFPSITLPQVGTSYYVQVASISGANDHNFVNFDVGRGKELDSTVSGGWGYPTAATVDAFTAGVQGGRVYASWQTGSEAGTLGFNLYREAAGGSRVLVNDALIPADFASAGAGSSYRVLDPGARPGQALTYVLEEVEFWGTTREHGPFTVTAAGALAASGRRTPEAAAGTGGPAALASTRLPFLGGHTVALAGAPADALRIEVSQPGMYAVTPADVAAAFALAPADARAALVSGNVTLTQRGVPVATTSVGDDLWFYGEALSTPYTDTNVYFLRLGKGPQMRSANPGKPAAAPLTSFADVAHGERDVLPMTSLFHDPEADIWLWGFVNAGAATGGTQSFTVAVPDVVAGETLRVDLHGMSDTGVPDEHHVQVRLNGVLLGEVRFAGAVAHSAEFALPGGALVSGANQVQLTGLLDTGAPYSFVGLDGVDVTYRRAAAAVGGQLGLVAGASGTLRVAGVPSASGLVFDVSDPRAPVRVLIPGQGSTKAAAWTDFVAVAGHRYAVATAGLPARPPVVEPAYAPGLAGGGAEYVVVTAPALAGAAAELAAYRAAQGMSTAVVTTRRIYDAFSDGIAGPWAIRGFLDWAAANWQPAPRYVVFAGEGSFDYKDVAGNGDCLVPSLLTDTEYGLAPSDALLAGDGAPGVALGRIPAATEAELVAFVDKLRRYEAAAPSSEVLFVADDSDSGGSFAADSETLAGLVPSWLSVSRSYLDVESVTTARARLKAAFNGGAAVVNYVGHGGVDRLTTNGLFKQVDLAELVSAEREPLFVGMTCMAGSFGLPGYDSIGERLVMKGDGGAIAVFAPTSMEKNVDSVLLDSKLLPAVLAGGRPVGEAVAQALAEYAATDGTPSLVRTYVLLGDPATVVVR